MLWVISQWHCCLVTTFLTTVAERIDFLFGSYLTTYLTTTGACTGIGSGTGWRSVTMTGLIFLTFFFLLQVSIEWRVRKPSQLWCLQSSSPRKHLMSNGFLSFPQSWRRHLGPFLHTRRTGLVLPQSWFLHPGPFLHFIDKGLGPWSFIDFLYWLLASALEPVNTISFLFLFFLLSS